MNSKVANINNSFRYNQAIEIISEFGFGTFISKNKTNAKAIQLNPEIRFRKILEKLQGGFIQLGIMLQFRPDLIPPSFAKECTQIKQDTKPMNIQHIIDSIELEYSRPLETFFYSMDKDPVESTTTYQIHQAKLTNKHEVFVKIIRSDFKKQVKEDLEVMEQIITQLKKSKLQHIQPEKILSEFKEYISKKIDISLERKFMIELQNKSSEKLIPEVYESLCTKNVLIYKYIKNKTKKEKNSKNKITLANLESQITIIQGEFIIGLVGIICVIISSLIATNSTFISRILLFTGLGFILLTSIIIVKTMSLKK